MFYSLSAANLLMVGLFGIKFSTFPPQIPLFYSRPWGESQLTDWWFIFLLPLLMDILYFFNLYLAKKFFSDSEFARQVIEYFNVALIIVFTLIFVKIIFLIS